MTASTSYILVSPLIVRPFDREKAREVQEYDENGEPEHESL